MTRPDRFRKLAHDSYDAIVVGAGTGGLVAAALLATRGKRVLVVDQHYVAGGNTTVFHRPGYEFDIGLHSARDSCGFLQAGVLVLHHGQPVIGCALRHGGCVDFAGQCGCPLDGGDGQWAAVQLLKPADGLAFLGPGLFEFGLHGGQTREGELGVAAGGLPFFGAALYLQDVFAVLVFAVCKGLYFEVGGLCFGPQLQPALGECEALLGQGEDGDGFLGLRFVQLRSEPTTCPQGLLQASKSGAPIGETVC